MSVHYVFFFLNYVKELKDVPIWCLIIKLIEGIVCRAMFSKLMHSSLIDVFHTMSETGIPSD